MKNHTGWLVIIVLAVVLLLSGCATKGDLKRLQEDLSSKIDAANASIKALQEEQSLLKEQLQGYEQAIAGGRTRQAEIAADITSLQTAMQELSGTTEALRKELQNAQKRGSWRDEELKELKERLDAVAFKTNFLENFLGIGKKELSGEAGERPARQTPKGKSDLEAAYAAAYEEFKNGHYEKARQAFQNFLRQYPATEYSDNAQFWIAESYYFEKNYEKAIVEYDKVVKNYPGGDKVPYALLKQGLAFLNLGDKASARVILQQVIKDYPNTNQARIARATLMEIK